MKRVLYFIYVTLFFSLVTNAQSIKKYSILYSEKREMNLKDSVKSVTAYYSKIKESLPRSVKGDITVSHGAWIVYRYLELDKNGHSVINIPCNILYYIDSKPFDLKDISVHYYDYDTKDLETKRNYKTATKGYFPVDDYDLLVKPNLNSYYWDEEFDSTGINRIKQKNRSEDIYTYKLDEKGRIKEELKYILFPSDSTPINNYSKENLSSRMLFFYNEKDQVVNQKPMPGYTNPDEVSVNTPSFGALGTESGFCNDLQLKYKYDTQGRMIQALFYGHGQTIAKEDYIYHPTKDYIQKVKCYVTGLGGDFNPTKNFIKTYNEQGEIIEKEFIPDYPEQNIYAKKKYYNYEYDSHNNWIKCNMYLEGTKEGEPSLVAERKIEYYN